MAAFDCIESGIVAMVSVKGNRVQSERAAPERQVIGAFHGSRAFIQSTPAIASFGASVKICLR